RPEFALGRLLRDVSKDEQIEKIKKLLEPL
ncbi:unnamed protein product, partial [marine sediment metagenome]